MLTIIEPRPDTLLPGRPIYTERMALLQIVGGDKLIIPFC